ncbi:hypothetical protein [Glycomyces sp. NPDC048151]|uniref:hypothetical protein n=1 Tax=Glycomyces sp. NPDC048151 TaxID=3364002 RepID=UPI00371F3484
MTRCIEYDMTGVDGTDLLRTAVLRTGLGHGNVLNLFGLAPDGKPVRLGTLVVGAHSRITAAWKEGAGRFLTAKAAKTLLNAVSDSIALRKDERVW